ncbi:MAG: ABC transporter ATP-binding protein [Burkholderiaceae bacterium]
MSAAAASSAPMPAAVPATAPKIRIEGVRKSFASARGRIDALAAIDLNVADGEFICLVGPSGCGKSTLLRILAELETPSSGRVAIRSTSQQPAPLTSMVFQEASIFPWMTVRENAAYGLWVRGLRDAEAARTVSHFLELTGLAAFADAYPHQLSGGMKQRVSVARAFANGPEVLLMDEPFAALDEQNKILLQEELLRIWEQTRTTVLFITHSIDEALVLADRVLVMSARPGRLIADIPLAFERPRSVMALKSDPEYGRISSRIWSLLRSEVVAR